VINFNYLRGDEQMSELKTDKLLRDARGMLEDKEYWLNHAEKLKLSNLTRKEYCRQSGVNYDRFGYWLPKLLPERFVPIKIKTKNSEASELKVLCSIDCGNGKLLKIHDCAALEFILAAL
jgi:hypothetical protein